MRRVPAINDYVKRATALAWTDSGAKAAPVLRRPDDIMANHFATGLMQLVATHYRAGVSINVGILGVTAREEVPDVRHSEALNLFRALMGYGIKALVHDPVADRTQAQEYGIELVDADRFRDLEVLVLAVPHRQILRDTKEKLPYMVDAGGIVCDVKSALDRKRVVELGLIYWAP